METAGAPHATPPAIAGGVDRRSLIKRAAAAGAIAWTTPVVLGSLASPAGALTYTGCYRVQFERGAGATTCSAFSRVTPSNGSGCLATNYWNNLPEFPGTVTLTPSGTAPNCTYVITLESDSGCFIDQRSAARKDQSNQCATGTAGVGCQQLTISATFLPDRLKVLISCDGVICAGGTDCTV